MTGAPDALVVPRAVLDEVLDHARAGLPAEACGVLAGRAGVASRFLPAINAAGLADVLRDLGRRAPAHHARRGENLDEDIVAIYRSHVGPSPAVPSRTDVEILGRWWPHVAWLIVSLGTTRRRPASSAPARDGRSRRELVVA